MMDCVGDITNAAAHALMESIKDPAMLVLFLMACMYNYTTYRIIKMLIDRVDILSRRC